MMASLIFVRHWVTGISLGQTSLHQRMVLQPRLEVDTEPGSFALDLRLRYEIRREIAPYIGISWQDASGEEDFVSFVAGARFWF